MSLYMAYLSDGDCNQWPDEHGPYSVTGEGEDMGLGTPRPYTLYECGCRWYDSFRSPEV